MGVRPTPTAECCTESPLGAYSVGRSPGGDRVVIPAGGRQQTKTDDRGSSNPPHRTYRATAKIPLNFRGYIVPMSAESDVALDLFLHWLRETYGRAFQRDAGLI